MYTFEYIGKENEPYFEKNALKLTEMERRWAGWQFKLAG